jgi:hypothetical protein
MYLMKAEVRSDKATRVSMLPRLKSDPPATGLPWRGYFLFFVALLIGACWCGQNQPSLQPAVVKGGEQRKKEPLPDDPGTKETRAAAGEILDRLLAGKLAEHESALARRAEALSGPNPVE